MSTPRQLAEYPEAELREELLRRADLRQRRLCDYCEGTRDTKLCNFPERHSLPHAREQPSAFGWTPRCRLLLDVASWAASAQDDEQIVTCEVRDKWYLLYLVSKVRLRGSIDPGHGSYASVVITPIPFPDEDFFDDAPTPYIDHVPNPDYLQKVCDKRGWTLDPLAREIIRGRLAEENGEYA